MKHIFYTLFIAFLIFSCASEKTGNLTVNGQIKGLRKGTLYLQKMNDTLLVSVDSIQLLGKDTFILKDDIDSPQMYYLTFDGNTTQKSIMFFAEEGTITINDHLEKFGINPKVSGSKNQEILQKFYDIDRRFKNQSLDFIKEKFDASKANNQELVNQIEEKAKKILRKRYLFAVNYAISNTDSEVAPYIALTELFNANVTYLDTINNSLTEKVKNSLYGKRLQKFIAEIKISEKK